MIEIHFFIITFSSFGIFVPIIQNAHAQSNPLDQLIGGIKNLTSGAGKASNNTASQAGQSGPQNATSQAGQSTQNATSQAGQSTQNATSQAGQSLKNDEIHFFIITFSSFGLFVTNNTKCSCTK